MKFLPLFAVIGLIFFARPVDAQDSKLIKVTALRVSKAAAAPYQTKHQGPNFDIDKEGVLRPHKGYLMVLDLATGRFRVAATEKQLSIKIEDGFDVAEIPGGMMWCFCDSNNDDCEISLVANDNKLIYHCGGRCGCIKLVESDNNWKIRDYETPGGGWFNF